MADKKLEYDCVLYVTDEGYCKLDKKGVAFEDSTLAEDAVGELGVRKGERVKIIVTLVKP